MGFVADPPAQAIPVVGTKEGKLIHDSGGFGANGKPAGPVMVDTASATNPPSHGFTPDAAPPKADPVQAANAAAQHEQLPGVGDAIKFFTSSLKNAPASVKAMISQAGDMVMDPYGTMGRTILHAAKTAQSAIENPEATISSVGTALRTATPEQAGATVGAPIVAGLGVGGAAGVAGRVARGTAAAASEAASDAGRIGLGTLEPHPVANITDPDAAITKTKNNQTAAEQALGADAGVPHDQPITHATLTDAAAAPGAVLSSGASILPTATLSPAAQAAIRAARPNTGLIKPTPDVASYIDSTENSLLGTAENPAGPITGADLRATRDGLVSDANAGQNSADAAVRQRAKYQRAVVNALDQHIADTMPANSAISPEMIANARATLGKNYSLRDLIGPGGDIDLQALAADHRANPNKYTGATRTVAQFASEHPEVTSPLSNAARLPQNILTDAAGLSPTRPVSSAIQALFGWAGRKALTKPTGISPPVAGLGGEFDLKPLTDLGQPPGAVGEPPSRQVPAPLAPGTGQSELPFTSPSELASPRPPQTVPPAIARGQSSGLKMQELGLGDDLTGAPRENNSDLAGVKSQGVPEGTMQRSPKSEAPEFSKLGQPIPKQRGSFSLRDINRGGATEVSPEFENVQEADRASGRTVSTIDPDGNGTPLSGVAARDVGIQGSTAGTRLQSGHIAIEEIPGQEPKILNRGNLSQSAANGLLARFKAHRDLGENF